MSPVGAIFVPSPTKTGENMVHPLPSPIVGLVFVQFQNASGLYSTWVLLADKNRTTDAPACAVNWVLDDQFKHQAVVPKQNDSTHDVASSTLP